jgi:uncharacterized heparinase superfamily protein
LGLSSIAERWRVARYVARRAAQRLRAAATAPVFLFSRWRFAAPAQLLIAPQDIRTTDPTIAGDIYGGFFNFASKIVNTHGASPFEIASPSDEWLATLYGFGWLRHLRAADTPLAHANARALVEEWMQTQGRARSGPAWDTAIASRRLLSWLSQSPLILDGADRTFYRHFMKNLGWHARLLERAMITVEPRDRLLAAIALAELGLCAQGFERLQRRATRWLNEELARQILPDGGHVGRCPQTLIDLLLDLLPLRQAYVARGVAAPPLLLTAIDRMMPMLRMFRHADGVIALFNGMGVTAPHTVATLLAYDDTRAAPSLNAPQSGYQRIDAEGSILIIDTGAPPPLAFSARADAGCLAFEFSTAETRVFVNCGAPAAGRPAIAQAARATAAHNCLVVADTNSSRIVGRTRLFSSLEGLIIGGPRRVPVKHQDTPDAFVIEASHDGYERRFGFIHTRTLALARDGMQLEGEDRLTTSGRKAASSGEFAVRFHLHPQVRLARGDSEDSVALLLPNGETWDFHAEGVAIGVDESIFFASPDGPRATHQLTIPGRVGENAVQRWSLTRRLEDAQAEE